MSEGEAQQSGAPQPEVGRCEDCGDENVEVTTHECVGDCNSSYKVCSVCAPDEGDAYVCEDCDQPAVGMD